MPYREPAKPAAPSGHIKWVRLKRRMRRRFFVWLLQSDGFEARDFDRVLTQIRQGYNPLLTRKKKR